MRKAVPFVIFFVAIVNGLVFGWIAHNQSECNFVGECTTQTCQGSTNTAGSTPIKFYIVEGGSYLYKANSKILQFFGLVEAGEIYGIDYDELKNVVGLAIQNQELAVDSYTTLISVAEGKSYNPEKTDQLKKFYYESYKRKNSLNGDVFDKVKNYLSNGDILGSYRETYYESLLTLHTLYSIYQTIESRQLPEYRVLWRLNQRLLQALLFGQYCAEIHMNLN